jgi:hypothetical protein
VRYHRRDDFADLWKTYTALRLDFEAPFGTYKEYVNRCDRNQIALEDLTSSLRVVLGVEQQELDITQK